MAKRKVIWSPQAKIDKFRILKYYLKRNGNKVYSQKLFHRFKKATKLLIMHPEIGVKTDIKNVRNLIEGDYCVFYKLKPEHIEIITIWDSRQNPQQINL